MRADYGLDRSLIVQLWTYIVNIVQLDFGESFYYEKPVFDMIMDRIGATVLLTSVALGVSLVIGVILGVYTARRPASLSSHGVTVLSLVGYALPLFWTGIMLIVLFAAKLDLLPVSGFEDVRYKGGWFGERLDNLEHLILPAFTLAIVYLAYYSRLARASMLEVLESDYIRTARAKGASERSVVYKHALRNALIPVVTFAGLQFGALFSGAVLVETVFDWPGLGLLAYESILTRDTPLMLGLLIVSAAMVIVANLVTDLVYRFIDPRIRVGGSR